jgi:site-specific DNA-methyltransferase (adenine-specific)
MDEDRRPYHEVANIFPLLQGAEFEQLKADIQANGLLEDITLHPDGSILDGRNRHRACLETGTPPRFVTWNGNGSLVAFVVSKNLVRRHLNETQRGLVASRLENMPQGRPQNKDANLHLLRKEAAEMLNVSPRTVATVKAVERDAPDLVHAMEVGKMTAHAATKEIRKRERDNERELLADSATSLPKDDRWHIEVGDVVTYKTDKQFDFIITDPPYPREFLPLYESLAIQSLTWLKPSGLVLVMCGQSYVDKIFELMTTYLTYYWTGCYHTPGQPTPLRQKQVNTNWKPILIFRHPGDVYAGKIFGDVWTSDNNDKDYHKWGQSVSGMLSIIKQVCLPGQSIFDPFCGAGTTGIAALKHGCLFHGIDIEQSNVDLSVARIAEAMK